ncbi:MAG TPA: SDR family NAD(P)-dependent oxidoreductase [Bacteroidales bacterium]|nr:SDR family NAD(P)-dependent oxidoreductase [Bacteroidales bacterium]HLN53294.1 SDR family NAD(P)-dependent oxidoreductase [Lentimicrobium sp.]
MNEEAYTLITGASSGIGKAMAWYCGSLQMNLILISLPGEKLDEVADQIAQKYHVKTRYFEIDLSQLGAPEEIFNWTQEEGLEISILVNNAGVAGASVFQNCDTKYIDDRILLNVRALVMLTHLFIPVLRKQPKSYILNVASMAAFFPIPYKSLYSSSKAFVLYFSRAVRCELKDSGISLSVICPNGVRTNTTTNTRINAHGFVGRITEITADEVARKGIDGMLKGKEVIIPGRINYFLLMLQKLLPVFIQHRILMKEFKKEVDATCKEESVTVKAGTRNVPIATPEK